MQTGPTGGKRTSTASRLPDAVSRASRLVEQSHRAHTQYRRELQRSRASLGSAQQQLARARQSIGSPPPTGPSRHYRDSSEPAINAFQRVFPPQAIGGPIAWSPLAHPITGVSAGPYPYSAKLTSRDLQTYNTQNPQGLALRPRSSVFYAAYAAPDPPPGPPLVDLHGNLAERAILEKVDLGQSLVQELARVKEEVRRETEERGDYCDYYALHGNKQANHILSNPLHRMDEIDHILTNLEDEGVKRMLQDPNSKELLRYTIAAERARTLDPEMNLTRPTFLAIAQKDHARRKSVAGPGPERVSLEDIREDAIDYTSRQGRSEAFTTAFLRARRSCDQDHDSDYDRQVMCSQPQASSFSEVQKIEMDSISSSQTSPPLGLEKVVTGWGSQVPSIHSTTSDIDIDDTEDDVEDDDERFLMVSEVPVTVPLPDSLIHEEEEDGNEPEATPVQEHDLVPTPMSVPLKIETGSRQKLTPPSTRPPVPKKAKRPPKKPKTRATPFARRVQTHAPESTSLTPGASSMPAQYAAPTPSTPCLPAMGSEGDEIIADSIKASVALRSIPSAASDLPPHLTSERETYELLNTVERCAQGEASTSASPSPEDVNANVGARRSRPAPKTQEFHKRIAIQFDRLPDRPSSPEESDGQIYSEPRRPRSILDLIQVGGAETRPPRLQATLDTYARAGSPPSAADRISTLSPQERKARVREILSAHHMHQRSSMDAARRMSEELYIRPWKDEHLSTQEPPSTLDINTRRKPSESSIRLIPDQTPVQMQVDRSWVVPTPAHPPSTAAKRLYVDSRTRGTLARLRSFLLLAALADRLYAVASRKGGSSLTRGVTQRQMATRHRHLGYALECNAQVPNIKVRA
ncbi:hypothetical protein GMRT_12191 [Giardia muris]|uniref:Uncharacterized protein n=1 Tax=Giardia muris TaxID=5742 RepID=A0A4Z1T5J7_GIAMU|nr:hypothetical protein GMRT_12191 [Giardia muris]|eukprot:TNJ27799.1 hypothetical protein GMRT_12191 [Giardia muris]